MSNVVEFKKRAPPVYPPQPTVQLFQIPGYPDAYRIVWQKNRPVRAEVYANKSFEWVQLQRYKEVQIINLYADWRTYGKQ